jgi:rhodanese-related sulfurtransferase
MAPLDILNTYGILYGYITAFIIGLGFGAVLEMSGFGDSRKLAAQFYLGEMRVLKVMFTAIIVAMTLIFLSSALGILDYEKVFVNPTYLVPGVVGGLIMGAGFIIGGFCPGTSLVGAATGKLDGMFFVGGVFTGVFIFGETVQYIENFWYGYDMGRFTLPEFFDLSTGITVILVLVLAFIMFYGAEISEAIFGSKKKLADISFLPKNKMLITAAATLLFLAVITSLIGQPDIKSRWNHIASTEQKKLESREVFIHPGELLEVMNDSLLYKSILDVRHEKDYNLFHLRDAINISLSDLKKRKVIKAMKSAPGNTVVVLMSNDEDRAIKAYKILRAQGILNCYILSGGVNNWLQLFGIDSRVAEKKTISEKKRDQLWFRFAYAAGEKVFPANPEDDHEHALPEMRFEKKVKVQKKKVIEGGCG